MIILALLYHIYYYDIKSHLNLNICNSVHIRRTDKVGTEAALHQVEEYMTAVDEYYKQREMVEKIDQRRVFLASDDPKVNNQMKK